MTGSARSLAGGPRVLPADPGDREGLRRIADHLDRGGLLAHPTETVYGLGAAADAAGVAALRELKGREERRPFLLLVPDDSVPLRWNPAARALARAFWPGPVTLVLFDPEGRFPGELRNEAGGVAVRVSPHPFVRSLFDVWRGKEGGGALLSTSANAAGGAPAGSAEEIVGWARGRPGSDRLWVADAGPLPPGRPSTVVDCTGDVPVVVRAGAVPEDRIGAVLEEIGGRTG